MTPQGWAIFIAVLVAAIIIVALVAWALVRASRRRHLRDRFGPEYDRTVDVAGSRTDAEEDLELREERVKRLRIRALTPDESAHFRAEWQRVQARFVDDPLVATAEADDLVGELLSTRGYPVADFDQRAADVSVDHPLVVEHYHAAHEIAGRSRRGETTTEDLRQALIHYRALFDELLETRTERPEWVESRRRVS